MMMYVFPQKWTTLSSSPKTYKVAKVREIDKNILRFQNRKYFNGLTIL